MTKPSLWLPHTSLRQGVGTSLRLLINGHKIYRSADLATQKHDQKSGNPGRLLFTCADSQWISPLMAEYALHDDAELLSGCISIAPLAGNRTLGTVAVELDFHPQIECDHCGNSFRLPCYANETLQLVSEESETLTGERETGAEPNPFSSEVLDEVPVTEKGLAIDALLLDAISLAMPDQPVCPECRQGEDLAARNSSEPT